MMLIVLFVIFFVQGIVAQLPCQTDTISISSNVGFVACYIKKYKDYVYENYAYEKNEKNKYILHTINFRHVKYAGQVGVVLIHPTYTSETRILGNQLRKQSLVNHDSILYAHLKEELHPHHFSDGACSIYCISPLQEWSRGYYVDTEEQYVDEGLEPKELEYELQFHRLLWVDSCQYLFSVYGYTDKKCKIARLKRQLRAEFQQLVTTIFIRLDDKLVELKKEE